MSSRCSTLMATNSGRWCAMRDAVGRPASSTAGVVRRFAAAAAAGSVVAVLLVGCVAGVPERDFPAHSDNSAPVPTSAPIAGPAAADALELVGLWRVTGVQHQSGDIRLRLSDAGVGVYEKCGDYRGSWNALEGHFIAEIYESDAKCGVRASQRGWLMSATGYSRVGEGHFELTDIRGNTVATLRTAETRTTGGVDSRAWNRRPPEVTERMRAQAAPPAPLPDGVTAVVPVGRWAPTTAGSTGSYVEFLANSSWHGSDGCYSDGGRWLGGSDGLIATANIWIRASYMCTRPSVPINVEGARRAGMLGKELRLYDQRGNHIASLVREESSR